jgi:multidrug resistance efflux pump
MTTGRTQRRRLIWGLGTAVTFSVAVGGMALSGILNHRTVAGATTVEPDGPERYEAMTVKTIRPRPDSSVQVTSQQFATVEPFFQADLKARVSGLVRAVHKDMNDRVHRGELLVEIDVPDLDYDVAQKLSVIAQREQEARLGEAKKKLAEAEAEVADATVKQRQAEISAAKAVSEAKKKLAARVKEMARRGVTQDERVEEVERDALAADSAVDAAKAAVEKARADAKEKQAGVLAADAEIELRRTLVEVARKDYARSAALADYARIRAPFDGVVVRRDVDPGSFVQNATTGHSEPLISIARTDLVTVSAKFPDNVAMFIQQFTPATIELDDLPNAAITAWVTRYSPSIRNSDRTMSVEIDLFNGTQLEFERFAARSVSAALTPLGGGSSLGVIAAQSVAQEFLSTSRKGANDGMPAAAFSGDRAGRLLPGMTGVLRLQLSRFGKSFVVPSSAVYTRGGKPYVLLVKDGVAHQMPVHIHVNDGTLAKLSLIAKVSDGRGTRELLRDLTGNEEIVASRQLEIGDGREVQTVPSEW